jgi:hypothetical protein
MKKNRVQLLTINRAATEARIKEGYRSPLNYTVRNPSVSYATLMRLLQGVNDGTGFRSQWILRKLRRQGLLVEADDDQAFDQAV